MEKIEHCFVYQFTTHHSVSSSCCFILFFSFLSFTCAFIRVCVCMCVCVYVCRFQNERKEINGGHIATFFSTTKPKHQLKIKDQPAIKLNNLIGFSSSASAIFYFSFCSCCCCHCCWSWCCCCKRNKIGWHREKRKGMT